MDYSKRGWSYMKKIKASHTVNTSGRTVKHTPSTQDVKLRRVTGGRLEKTPPR